jgi:hypothetical protein
LVKKSGFFVLGPAAKDQILKKATAHTVKKNLYSYSLSLAILLSVSIDAGAQTIEEPIAARLPVPSPVPLAVDNSADPILALAEAMADENAFQDVIREAMRASPILSEGRAEGRAAIAAKAAAIAGQYPRIDFALSANRAIAGNFPTIPIILLKGLVVLAVWMQLLIWNRYCWISGPAADALMLL